MDPHPGAARHPPPHPRRGGVPLRALACNEQAGSITVRAGGLRGRRPSSRDFSLAATHAGAGPHPSPTLGEGLRCRIGRLLRPPSPPTPLPIRGEGGRAVNSAAAIEQGGYRSSPRRRVVCPSWGVAALRGTSPVPPLAARSRGWLPFRGTVCPSWVACTSSRGALTPSALHWRPPPHPEHFMHHTRLSPTRLLAYSAHYSSFVSGSHP